MRPRAEDCQQLRVGQLRQLVRPGDRQLVLNDGTTLLLHWAPVRGCWGGEGVALVVACPACGARCRLLRRPPGEGWGCWRCRPISHPSHRRPGTHGGQNKPPSWKLARNADRQQQAAELLGLQQWPPKRVLWSRSDLLREPRRPDAPVLSARRELALIRRLDALESERLGLLLPSIRQELEQYGGELPDWPNWDQHLAEVRRQLAQTAWAVRRPAGDPRTTRGRKWGLQAEKK